MSSPPDIDIWRTANLLLKRHGSEAAIVAAQRADELLAKGDIDGQFVWKRVLRATEGLQRTKLLNGEHLN